MAHLLSLPPEILHSICASFCHHCNSSLREEREAFKGAETFKRIQHSVAALSSMSQTCTILRNIAQPYLYHYPCSPAASIYILSTLVERPDLAQHVKSISLYGVRYREDVPSKAVDVLRAFLLKHKHVRGNNALENAREWYLYPSNSGDLVDDYDDRFNTLLTAIVLTKVPNLESLHLELDFGCEFPFCQPGSFPRLKELVVQFCEIEVGADILRDVEFILRAAPALERFGGIQIAFVTWNGTPLLYDSVREISLPWSCVGFSDLKTLFGQFPRVEAFTYESNGESDGWEEASPGELGEALLLYRDTLRFLSIDYTNSMWEDRDIRAEAMGSLAELKRLEKLRLDAFVLFRDSEGTHGRWVTICEMLPVSIVQFEVTRAKLGILNELIELARVASQRLPALKSVTVIGFEGDTNNVLRQAFEQSGIEFSTKDPQEEGKLWQI
ncbi:hypothetical protein ACHAPT_008982 [Fusarium lateritium]